MRRMQYPEITRSVTVSRLISLNQVFEYGIDDKVAQA